MIRGNVEGISLKSVSTILILITIMNRKEYKDKKTTYEVKVLASLFSFEYENNSEHTFTDEIHENQKMGEKGAKI